MLLKLLHEDLGRSRACDALKDSRSTDHEAALTMLSLNRRALRSSALSDLIQRMSSSNEQEGRAPKSQFDIHVDIALQRAAASSLTAHLQRVIPPYC